LLSNIFNSIKNEEVALFTREIIDEKSKAVQNGQINDSSYVYAKINLAKDCINTVYKKILIKLKNDKLNHFIKKNSDVFLDFVDELTDDVFEIITTEMTRTNSAEEKFLLDNTYKGALFELKNEIINQWNNEAIIQSHLKKQERVKQFRIYIITFVITLMGAIIAGIVLNQNHLSTKPVQNVIQKEVRINPSTVIEKVLTSPDGNKKDSYFYKVFKNFDKKEVRQFLKALYLKFS